MVERSEESVLIERFWAKADVRGPDECWTWKGHKCDGYASIKVDNRNRKASRVLHYLTHGEWPRSDLEMCHTCDNPACVNPAHIYPGTNMQNMTDKRTRKRAVGKGCGKPKLRGLADEMLRRHDSGESLSRLAAAYGVTREAIKYHIRKRKAQQVST